MVRVKSSIIWFSVILDHNIDPEDVANYSRMFTSDDSGSYLNQDILSLLNPESDSSDVTLVCGDVRFPAHKAILAARSDVFATMFKHRDTKEAATNEVKIDDADPDTMNRFLQ